MSAPPDAVAEALRVLDKRNVVLAIHDPSFPSLPGEELGRGSPYSRGAEAFLTFARGLGFTGLQLGPQGQTSRVNASPYDATLFSRNVLSIDFWRLRDDPRWAPLVDETLLEEAGASNPEPAGARVAHPHAYDRAQALVDALHRRFQDRRARGRAGALAQELSAFRAGVDVWLEADPLFELLCAHHAGVPWEEWPARDRDLWDPPPGGEGAARSRLQALHSQHADALERWALAQLAWQHQHGAFRARARALGLELFADLQVGLSPSDAWARRSLLLRGYRLGAPPSRTNPAGQPWNHGVFDPAQLREADGRPGPVARFLHDRLAKLFDEADGLRVDHPHGLVCPWVYRADGDPQAAVQQGARLFSAPDLPDHPGLARFAIPRPDQLDRAAPRHADGWVRDLEPEQVEQYAALFDEVIAEARRHGRHEQDVLCEVLSTQPHPLARVLARHGLGRFRVTQKARLDDPDDVYRSENARPEDWIMVGNHDTPSLWALVRRWHGTPAGAEQADYLASRLQPDDPVPLARALRADPRALAHAKVADCFASRARSVMVFFGDLLGLEEPFNSPGTVNEVNWSLRAPRDYASRSATEGLSLPRVLALAVRARGEAELARQLVRRFI